MDYGKLCSKCSYATENIYSEIGTPAQELIGIALAPLVDTQIKFLIKVLKFMEMLCSGGKKNNTNLCCSKNPACPRENELKKVE